MSKDQIVLRAMQMRDIQAVHEIETLVFSTPWSRESFSQELTQNKAARYLVLEKDEAVLAYGGMWFVIDEAHITNIAVHPDHRRQGYGEAITQGLLDVAKENGMHLVTLEVRRSNLCAQALYHKLGFVDVGYRKRYYNDNHEDALIMYCALPEG